MNSEHDESPASPQAASHSEVTHPVVAPELSAAPVAGAAPPADPSTSPPDAPGASRTTETPETEISELPVPRIKIGTQRPGSPVVRARPLVHRYIDSTATDAGAEQNQAAGAPATTANREVGGDDQGVARRGKKFPVPNLRKQLPPELEYEVEAALGGISLEEALAPSAAPAQAELEPESRHQARVMRVHRENVFVDLGQRNEGLLPLKLFREPPAVGAALEVTVQRFDADEGLYQLSLPHAAIAGANWGDLSEGVLVEANVTGHNKGGLECEVNHIRGFIPASQIGPYRVEDFAQYVGQKLLCLVTEANPQRGNLVLSRRAVLEREQAEAKERLFTELKEGEIREGVVRSLQAFGAFVDLGGIDGLLHVSQLSWQRVKHPSDVLQLGQPIRVLIRKIDPETRKISLALRDLTENPWTTAAAKYPAGSRVQGPVTKIMEFGAFVQVEPGVEGLVHISELAHQRVHRVGDVIKEGDVVEAKVLSVDQEQQRIGLSIKALAARPMPVKKDEPADEAVEEPATRQPAKPRKQPLKGGIGRGSGGEQFGLKW